MPGVAGGASSSPSALPVIPGWGMGLHRDVVPGPQAEHGMDAAEKQGEARRVAPRRPQSAQAGTTAAHSSSVIGAPHPAFLSHALCHGALTVP